nr:TetR/AcrR family transcription regulator [uncultured bacterium]
MKDRTLIETRNPNEESQRRQETPGEPSAPVEHRTPPAGLGIRPEEESKYRSPTAQRIIQAAARVFSQQGFAGATTRAIAAEAGINEVTLFRHFGSKKNLMLAVINQRSVLPEVRTALMGQLTGDYRQDLLHIGTHFLASTSERRNEILMTLFEAQRLPEIRDIIAQVPLRQQKVLGQYLRHQIEQGVVRDMDPDLAAQAFLGMFFAYATSYLMLAGPDRAEIPLETVAALFVDIFVEGTT